MFVITVALLVTLEGGSSWLPAGAGSGRLDSDFRLKAEATRPRLVWLPALAGRLRATFDWRTVPAEASTSFGETSGIDGVRSSYEGMRTTHL